MYLIANQKIHQKEQLPRPSATIHFRQSVTMHSLRQMQADDFEEVARVYRDAVISQAKGLYSGPQIEAWANHVQRDPGLRRALATGYGLVSCLPDQPRIIEAFALLNPIDRLSLLYSRGRACRRGHATALLGSLEEHARRNGCSTLRTEASQLSRPLLLRRGWQVEAEEEVMFAGCLFVRWRMIKELV
jgi:GNAT superfamily N-acetyltransferase